ncbi:MAG: HDOD domain-containing protein [Sulfuriflexus sp.]|nr:HDOD domain-containing protein [Sulfuriflexus sp.]
MEMIEEFYTGLIEDISNNKLELPTLPEVALKVRETVEDDNVNARKVADVIGSDAALSARLIQVANSPMYRGSSPIEDIQMAVARMGFTVTRDLVVGLAMRQMFQATSDVTDIRLRLSWEHSTQVAGLTTMLCKHFTKLKPDQAMLAGLVHDIGVLPILVRAEEYPDLLENPALLDSLTRELHPRLGTLILDSWDFPQELVDVAAQHENLEYDSGDKIDYVDLVQVANIQAHQGNNHPLANVDVSKIPSCIKLGMTGEEHDIGDIGDAEELQGILVA